MAALRYREARVDDAALAADLMSVARPWAPVDPVVLRYEWEHPSPTFEAHRFMVEDGGATVAVASYAHPVWERNERWYGSVSADVARERRDAATLAALLGEMERRLGGEGARLATARANEDDPVLGEAIRSLGYREDRRGRRWELDLVAERVRILAMAETSRGRMRQAGIHLLTLADDPDPERYRKVWQMSIEAERDVPATLPHPEETLDDYLLWIRGPDMHEDRFWIARDGDDVVGCSVLSYPPARGPVGTAWTATARRVRGKGVARALKCETLVQAIGLGVERVRTGNDAANDPILHINASMGYRPAVGVIAYLKELAPLR